MHNNKKNKNISRTVKIRKTTRPKNIDHCQLVLNLTKNIDKPSNQE